MTIRSWCIKAVDAGGRRVDVVLYRGPDVPLHDAMAGALARRGLRAVFSGPDVIRELPAYRSTMEDDVR